MPFGFKLGQSNMPVVGVDFGVSSLKVLQLTGDSGKIIAAGCAATPDDLIEKPAARLAHQANELPKLLRECGIKGRRAVCSVPAGHTFVQHLHVPRSEGATRAGEVQNQLRTLLGADPERFIVRLFNVCEVTRGGQRCEELLCIAIPRDIVLAHVRALAGAGLEAVGVQSEHLAAVRAFDSITRRVEDEALSSIIVDLGYGSTKVGITHGREPVFAKTVHVAGRQLDRALAKARKCAVKDSRRTGGAIALDPAQARIAAATAAMSMNESAVPGVPIARGATAPAPALASGPVVTAEDRRAGSSPQILCELGEPPVETVDTGAASTPILSAIADEIAMCVRYHQALFPGRKLDRFVLAGGEARQVELARAVGRAAR
ncbi:MAG TPA: pilus assembly protein PilM, partial [Phycisphaerales bacterium]|nr:pilus assembly protein PilM [Phycisphaerales bacterium]